MDILGRSLAGSMSDSSLSSTDFQSFDSDFSRALTQVGSCVVRSQATGEPSQVFNVSSMSVVFGRVSIWTPPSNGLMFSESSNNVSEISSTLASPLAQLFVHSGALRIIIPRDVLSSVGALDMVNESNVSIVMIQYSQEASRSMTEKMMQTIPSKLSLSKTPVFASPLLHISLAVSSFSFFSSTESISSS